MSKDTITVIDNINGRQIELPVQYSTQGPPVVGIGGFYHKQNASTSTVRLAGSSRANPFACIASGIAALWDLALRDPHKISNKTVKKQHLNKNRLYPTVS